MQENSISQFSPTAFDKFPTISVLLWRKRKGSGRDGIAITKEMRPELYEKWAKENEEYFIKKEKKEERKRRNELRKQKREALKQIETVQQK